MVLAWFSGSIALVVYGGDGKHIWDVTYQEYNWFDRVWRNRSRKLLKVSTTWLIVVQLAFVDKIIYLPAAILIKMSIVLFNRRITGLASKTWRRINDGFLFILMSYMIAFSIWIAARCSNLNLTLFQVGQAKNFKYCNPYLGLKIGLGMVAIHVSLGFCLLATPIIVLWKVRMDRIKKIQLFIVFAVGSVSCIAALMIIVAQYQIHEDLTCTYPACDWGPGPGRSQG